jgi:hypothetical protein
VGYHLKLRITITFTYIIIYYHLYYIISFVVQDDSKLPNDSGEVPKLNGVVGGSILDVKLSLYLIENLTRWSSTSRVPKYYIYIYILSPMCLRTTYVICVRFDSPSKCYSNA